MVRKYASHLNRPSLTVPASRRNRQGSCRYSLRNEAIRTGRTRTAGSPFAFAFACIAQTIRLCFEEERRIKMERGPFPAPREFTCSATCSGPAIGPAMYQWKVG